MYKNISPVDDKFSTSRSIFTNIVNPNMEYLCIPRFPVNSQLKFKKIFILTSLPNTIVDLKKFEKIGNDYTIAFKFNRDSKFRVNYCQNIGIEIFLLFNNENYQRVSQYHPLQKMNKSVEKNAIEFMFNFDIEEKKSFINSYAVETKRFNFESTLLKANEWKKVPYMENGGKIDICLCLNLHLKNELDMTIGYAIFQLDQFSLD